MRLYSKRALNLMETVVAIILLTLVILGFNSIDLFSRSHVIGADRRARLQNDLSYTLEHMTKIISMAIGDSSSTVNINPINGEPAIRVWVDYNANGQRDGSDRQSAYVFKSNAGTDQYQFWYYPNYTVPGDSHDILSRNISTFTPAFTSGTNYAGVYIVACWDPDGSPLACGVPNNPKIEMRSSMSMPAVPAR